MAKRIDVVGAVVIRNGLVLCAQRGVAGELSGLWEFPGGKIEPGESGPEALSREISEELGVAIHVGDPITVTTYRYDFATVILATYYCELISGEPAAREHAALRWLAPQDLFNLEWAPADIPAVEMVQVALS